VTTQGNKTACVTEHGAGEIAPVLAEFDLLVGRLQAAADDANARAKAAAVRQYVDGARVESCDREALARLGGVAAGLDQALRWAQEPRAEDRVDHLMAEEDVWTGTWCPQCGPDVACDDNGTCCTCGATAVGEGAEAALAWRAFEAFLSQQCGGQFNTATAIHTDFEGEGEGDDHGPDALRRKADIITETANALVRHAREMAGVGSDMAIVKQLRDLLFSTYRRVDELQEQVRVYQKWESDLLADADVSQHWRTRALNAERDRDGAGEVHRLRAELVTFQDMAKYAMAEAKIANERANERDAKVVELRAELADLRAKLADSKWTP